MKLWFSPLSFFLLFPLPFLILYFAFSASVSSPLSIQLVIVSFFYPAPISKFSSVSYSNFLLYTHTEVYNNCQYIIIFLFSRPHELDILSLSFSPPNSYTYLERPRFFLFSQREKVTDQFVMGITQTGGTSSIMPKYINNSTRGLAMIQTALLGFDGLFIGSKCPPRFRFYFSYCPGLDELLTVSILRARE